jgi:hypothetical protein
MRHVRDACAFSKCGSGVKPEASARHTLQRHDDTASRLSVAGTESMLPSFSSVADQGGTTMLAKIGMAAAAALICSAAHAETAAPAKMIQLAQAKPAAGQNCPLMLAPVCGAVKGKPTNFNNDCEAQRAKAKNVRPGACPPSPPKGA